MMDNDELMQKILSRGEQVQKRRAEKKRQILYGLSASLCLVLLFLTASVLPRINETATASLEQHYGSLILTTPYMGYVVIALLAFACGIFTALLFSSIRSMKQDR